MVEPIGWSSTKHSLHLKTVFPQAPDIGMYSNLHRNLTKKLLPKEVVTRNQHNVDVARRILHRQRIAIRLFSGSRLNLKGSTPHETSARLHRPHFEQPWIREHTAPALDMNRELSDVYSHVKSEGSTLLTEASVYGQFPPLTSVGQRGTTMTPVPSSALSRCDPEKRVDKIVERLSTYDPEKVPDSKGYLVRLPKPIVYKKKYTEDEIQGIVKRLSEYHPVKGPAESKGVRETPSVVTVVPRQSMTRIKKCSSEEVQDIVQRLYKFDTEKLPPESKPRIMRSAARTAASTKSMP